MDRLSITTHLIAILTAFSAFTMPIAIEVLNRIKSRYGSADYMDCIEKIMGFKVRFLFRELIFILITLVFFTLLVSSLDKNLMPDESIRLFELAFSILTASILYKEFVFIRVILSATRSDDLVVDHLIATLESKNRLDKSYSEEVELLIQIACYNVENSITTTEESTENRLFKLVENACFNKGSKLNDQTLKYLIDGLAAILTSARKTNNRERYVSIQRKYGKLLVFFYDEKIREHDVFDFFSNKFYEESIKELNTDQHWSLKADFLIGVWIFDIKNLGTIKFVNEHIRRLIDFLVESKPHLIVDLLNSYQCLNQFDSHFEDDIYLLSYLFGFYNRDRSSDVVSFVEKNKTLLKSNAQEYINRFILLLDAHVQDALVFVSDENQRAEINSVACKYESEMRSNIIKSVCELTAKSMANYALSSLARKEQWDCILECCDSFNPVYSDVCRLGVNIFCININSVVKQLGELDFSGSIYSEELNHAYTRAVPIFIMHAIYSWRIKNLDKSLEDGFEEIIGSVDIRDGYISNAKKILRNLKKVAYYAKSPIYATTFCMHYHLEHETSSFEENTLSIIMGLQFSIEKQISYMIKTKPLSENLKQDYIGHVVMDGKDISSIYPLFSYVSLSSKRKAPIISNIDKCPREQFLEKTGVTYSNFDKGYIKRLHNLVALRLISNKGCPISKLNLDDIDKDFILIISNEDWSDLSKTMDVSQYSKVKRIMVPTISALGAFYIFNPKDNNPLVTVYSNGRDEESVLLGDNIKGAFDFDFVDDDGETVKVKTEVHVYL